jgi:hypothetical protein
MLGVMIYQVASPVDPNGSLPAIPDPLPEAERPKLPIDTEKLEVIRDNTSFKKVEHEALFHLFDVLRSTPDEKLQQASGGNVTWIQLFNQPNVYRGEPITLVGRVQRVTLLSTPKNDLGFQKYYQLWLLPRDTKDRLIAIYCLELPEDFPVEMKINEPIVLTGLFFKRWVYMGQKDLELAPVVLARSFEWIPPPEEPPSDPNRWRRTMAIMIAVAIVVSMGIFLFWHFRTRRRKQTDLPEEITIPEEMTEVRAVGDDEDDGNVDEDGPEEEREE